MIMPASACARGGHDAWIHPAERLTIMHRRKAPYRSKPGNRRSPAAPRLRPGADSRLKKVFSGIGVPKKKPFTPDEYQLRALKTVRRDDCLVTAPTGSGKTWIAEQVIAGRLAEGERCWYASPLKALSNAKYREFSTLFGAAQVGILTGDRKENPDAPVIVGTTEILRNQLYDAMHQGLDLATDFVILDEAHYLGEEDRGVVWEETMIYLPARVPLLLLSATIGNAGQIAGWLSSIRERNCVVVEETRRPVPLHPLFLHPSGTLLPLTAGSETAKKKPKLHKKVRTFLNSKKVDSLARGNQLPPFSEILGVLRRYHLLPAIFFLKSRADCDRAIELCRENRIEDEERRQLLSRRIDELLSISPHVAHHRHRRPLAHLAVGSHHSGQLPAWKLVLESLMTEGLLDAVFATSTVAAGVNFPARTVLLLNSDRFNGREFVPLTATEFHQMTGRAGRRGMDRIGFMVAIPGRFMNLHHLARMVSAPATDVDSQIRINFSMVLNLLLSHAPEEIEDLLAKSFATYRARKKGSGPAQAPRPLWNDFLRHLRFLKETGFVDENDMLTEDGRWASQLRVDQPVLIAEGLRTGVLPRTDPALLAGIIGAFVHEREADDRIEKAKVPKKLLTAFLRVKRELRPCAHLMIERGFEVRPLFLRPAVTLFAWAAGQPWDKVVQLSEIEEGNLAMLILRTADNLRHVRSLGWVFPEAAAAAGAAIDMLLRDPVMTE